MVVFKSVKPDLLKVNRMRLALLNPMRKIGRIADHMYASTYEHWETKPEFKIERHLNSREGFVSVVVWTENQIYRWINDGTEGPYPILPGALTGKSEIESLRFFVPSLPKSIPGALGSRPGRPGNKEAYSKGHMHPGIEARKFDEIVKERMLPIFKEEIKRAMEQAARESGHAI